MREAILYHISMQRVVHGRMIKSNLGVAHSKPAAADTLTQYHLIDGVKLVPDFAAIRSMLPTPFRRAYDRMDQTWRFPSDYAPGGLPRTVGHAAEPAHSATRTLYDARKTRVLLTLFATPYRFTVSA